MRQYRYGLAGLLFAEGFLSLALQMLAIRQLLYVSGGTILETSLVVGFFLLALARGYQRGGDGVADPLRLMARNLLYAAAASVVFTPWVSAKLFSMGYGPGMIIYIGLGVTPIAYFMGQSLPLLVQAQTAAADGDESTAAQYAGGGLGLSTYGSFIGAAAVPLIGFSYLGVGATHVALVAMASALAIVLMRDSKAVVASTCIVVVTLMLSGRSYVGQIAEDRGPYGDIAIVETADGDLLWLTNQLIMSRKKRSGGYAWYANKWRVSLADGPEQQNVLVLGAAGFTVSDGMRDGIRFTYVDINPVVKQLSEDHFISPGDARFVHDDARRYLLQGTERYDRILVDVFASNNGIPEQLITVEALELMRARLAPAGEIWINTIQRSELVDKYATRLQSTVMSVMPLCRRIVEPMAPRIRNILYRCPGERPTPYRDNKTSAAIDAALM